jgi:hypothetical protein
MGIPDDSMGVTSKVEPVKLSGALLESSLECVETGA